MNITSIENDALLYAKHFSGSLTGSRYLMFRDVPELIEKHVTGTVALDYGCGPGRSTLYLKSLNFLAEGVDINEHMINLAKENDPSGKYDFIKSGRISRVENYYDLVFSSIVFVHVSTKEELFKIFQEIARVLNVGGTFITIVTSKDTFKYEWLSAKTKFEENEKLYSGSPARYYCKESNLHYHVYHWYEDDYAEAITNAGLNIVQIHRPMGKDTDGFEWINEKERQYCTIFVSKKLPKLEQNGN